MRLLIVEDEQDLCRTMAQVLRSDGYEVDACGDGGTALELATVESYDLILLDLNLPVMDGMEVLRRLRMENAEVKILILSARTELQDKVVCTPSSRQRNNLHFTHENPSCIPYGAGCYAASRRSWTSIGVRTPRPRWRRWKL